MSPCDPALSLILGDDGFFHFVKITITFPEIGYSMARRMRFA
jgi:hypothetical protein